MRGQELADRLADQVKRLPDIRLPPLSFFNSQPCADHAELSLLCQDCGVRLRQHQRVGVAWLYLRGKGLLADATGSGKTVVLAAFLALLEELDELRPERVLVVCRAQAVLQHQRQFQRFLPSFRVAASSGRTPRAKRLQVYQGAWDICVVAWQTLVNDHEALGGLPLRVLVVDDVDALRDAGRRFDSSANKTSYAVKRLAAGVPRVVVATATPLQKRLPELYSILEPLGGRAVFGSMREFRRRYVREVDKTIWLRGGRRQRVRELVGYRDVDEFRRLAEPFILRRTEFGDVDMPAVVPHNVWLELHPDQRAAYQELRQQARGLIRREGSRVGQAAVADRMHRGARICAGMASVGEPDGPEASSKLDWVMRQLEGPLEDEKAVVFSAYRATVEVLSARLRAAGIGHVVIWGPEADPVVRQERLRQFWEDPGCRVLVGTTAIEQSLNIHCARHLINIDLILNPARMQQLAGRIKRDGSPFKHVFAHNLLCLDTQEEGYLKLLEREAALSDFMFSESNELFARLSPLAPLQLISGS